MHGIFASIFAMLVIKVCTLYRYMYKYFLVIQSTIVKSIARQLHGILASIFYHFLLPTPTDLSLNQCNLVSCGGDFTQC